MFLFSLVNICAWSQFIIGSGVLSCIKQRENNHECRNEWRPSLSLGDNRSPVPYTNIKIDTNETRNDLTHLSNVQLYVGSICHPSVLVQLLVSFSYICFVMFKPKQTKPNSIRLVNKVIYARIRQQLKIVKLICEYNTKVLMQTNVFLNQYCTRLIYVFRV